MLDRLDTQLIKQTFIRRAFPLVLKRKRLPARKRMQIRHIPTHKFQLLTAGTVTSIEHRWVTSKHFYHFRQFFTEWHFGKMEASDEDVRRKPIHNIQNSLMRTTAKQDAFSVFLYHQILFMTKIVGNQAAVLHFGQAEMIKMIFSHFIVARKKAKRGIDFINIIRKNDSGIVCNRDVETNIFV